ncbi:MAG: hypothetical protein EHM90_00085 [Chloroflexi bacterium]|nr:MAG: hypothetical protein EHM90_06230 [Chloroflexota bacterium]RPH37175.1 MAG: hypothetical protein EHM90_00085 [Chloroflexota bacterium]
MTVAADLHALTVQIRAVPFHSMIAAARAVKKVAADEGKRAGGPLKGKKRRALKLRARDEIREAGPVTNCRIQGVSPAGWVWVTYGTAAHDIRRRKKGPMKVMTVRHPGTRGRAGWDVVAQRAARIVPLIFDDDLTKVIGHG